MKTETTRVTLSMIRRSHEQQFHGKDWQQVAQDLADEIENCTDDEYKELCGGPDPGCECGFCARAPWVD